jgi:hypothetical protein
MKQSDESDPHPPPGTRPPDYVVVVSASDWIKDHFPVAGVNLWDALLLNGVQESGVRGFRRH